MSSFRRPVGNDPSPIQVRVHHRLMVSLQSPLVMNLTLLASGAIAGTLEFITHLTVIRMKMPPAFDAFFDAGVVALMTIALVGVCIKYAAARQRVMLQKIRTASDLNHHLRNALQVITQSRYLPEEKQAQAVYASIDRIEEALRRLNPQ
jgi:hypothetical protein